MTSISNFFDHSDRFVELKTTRDKKIKELKDKYADQIKNEFQILKDGVAEHHEFLINNFWDNRLGDIIRVEAVVSGVEFLIKDQVHHTASYTISWTGLKSVTANRKPGYRQGAKFLETRDGRKVVALTDLGSYLDVSVIDKKGYKSDHRYDSKGLSKFQQRQFDLYYYE